MSTTKRIEYIDAIRGFTMILVITGHIYSMCFMHEKFREFALSYNNFFELFLMPLFFFISGFVFYKPNIHWDSTTLKGFAINKTRTLLFSALVFFLLFCFIYQKNVVHSFFDIHKSGYWFTYVLFIFYTIYIIIDKFVCWFAQKSAFCNHTIILTNFAGLLLYYFISNGFILNILPISISSLLSINKWHYFFFFSFGCMIHHFYNSFIKIQNTKYVKDVILLLFICLFIFIFYQNSTHIIIHNYILKLFTALLGIILIMLLFKDCEKALSLSTKKGNCLQYIGRHTLDIYFLHFFFMPYNMTFVGEWLEKYPNPILEFCMSISLALIVIIFCLLVSKIIHMSPLLAYLLLGEKHIDN